MINDVIEGMIRLMIACLYLEEINISGCSLISDNSIIALAQSPSPVKKLKITNCKLLSDHGISHLSSKKHSLIELNLSGCELITEEGVLSFLSNTENLKELWLQGCLSHEEYSRICDSKEIKNKNIVIWD